MDIYFEYILFHHSNCQISVQATILVPQLSQLALFYAILFPDLS